VKLLEKLNKHATLTPDQIVAKLRKTWVYFATLTQEQADELADKRMAIFEYSHTHQRWVVDNSNWCFWGHEPGELQYFHRALKNYAAILTTEYEHGDLPDRIPER